MRADLLEVRDGSTAVLCILSLFFQQHFVLQCRSGLKSPNGIRPLTPMVCINARQLAVTYRSGALNPPVLSSAAGRHPLRWLPYSPLYRNQPANRHVPSMFPRQCSYVALTKLRNAAITCAPLGQADRNPAEDVPLPSEKNSRSH